MKRKILLIVMLLLLFFCDTSAQKLTFIKKDVKVEATSGKETFANKNGSIFGSEIIDPNLLRHSRPGKKNDEILVSLFKVEAPANFFEMLSFFGCSDLSSLWVPESQVIKICREHKEWFMSDGSATFFLSRSNDRSQYNQMYYMICVFVKDGEVSFYLNDIGRNHFWTGFDEVRLVVRQ